MILAIEDVNERIHTIRYDGNTRAFASFQTHTTTRLRERRPTTGPFDVAWDLGTRREHRAPRLLRHDAGSGTSTSATAASIWTGEQTLTTLYQAHWVQLERDPSNVVHLVDQGPGRRPAGLDAGRPRPGPSHSDAALDQRRDQRRRGERREPSPSPPTRPLGCGTTAVKLMSFAAVPGDASVTLEWRTGSELDNLGLPPVPGPVGGRSVDAPDVVADPGSRLVAAGAGVLLARHGPRERAALLLPAGGRGHGVEVDVPRAGLGRARVAASSPPGEGGEGDGGGDDAEGGDGEPVPGSCPSWVLAAAPDAVSPDLHEARGPRVGLSPRPRA